MPGASDAALVEATLFEGATQMRAAGIEREDVSVRRARTMGVASASMRRSSPSFGSSAGRTGTNFRGIGVVHADPVSVHEPPAQIRGSQHEPETAPRGHASGRPPAPLAEHQRLVKSASAIVLAMA